MTTNEKLKLEAYYRARKVWEPLSKRLAELMHEGRRLVLENIRIAGRPRSDKVELQIKELLGNVKPDSEAGWNLQHLSQQLDQASAEAKQAYSAVKEATDDLTALAEEMSSEVASEILSQRSAMLDEIATFLAPFCESPRQAREIAENCHAVQSLEFEASQLRTIHDPASRVERLARRVQRNNNPRKVAK